MGEFFKPWRRKMSVVTLVVAIAFMGMWMRSLTVQESISIPVAQNISCGVVSGVGSIGVTWITDLSEPGSNSLDWQSNKLSLDELHEYDAAEEMGVQYSWDCCGIGIAESSEMSKNVVILPYSLIVIPLTAFSAFLLLTKPGQSPPKETHEPTANEGA